MFKRKPTRAIALAVMLAVLLTAIIPAASFASVKGRRTTAIALTAVSIYELARGHTGVGLVAGAGAAYAWKRYSKARQSQVYRRGYVAGRRTRRVVGRRSYAAGYGRGRGRHYGFTRGRHRGYSHSRYYRGAPGGFRR